MSVKIFGLKLLPWLGEALAGNDMLKVLDQRRDWINSRNWRDSTIRLSTPGAVISEPKAKGDALEFEVQNPTKAPVAVWTASACQALYDPVSFGEPLKGAEWIVDVPPFVQRVCLAVRPDFDWYVDFTDPLRRVGKSPWSVRVLIDDFAHDIQELEALAL